MSNGFPLTEEYDPTLCSDAELAVLGAALQSSEAAIEAVSDLEADDFYSQQHQIVFDAIQDLVSDQVPVDEIMVVNRLRESGQLEAAGGVSFVSSLTHATPDVANVGYHIGMVKNEAHKRRITHAAKRLLLIPGDSTARREMENLLLCPYYAGPGLEVIGLKDFFSMELPEREYLLYPWLQAQDLVMIYAWRGVGKTTFAAGISCAVSSGTDFLCWKAPQARGVLYVDGELQMQVLRDRFMTQQEALGIDGDLMIRILSHEQTQGHLTLATPQGRKSFERTISDDIWLVVFDNLSCLYGGVENEADAWQEMLELLLRLRRRGLAVILIHHAGKGGKQRGTSRREDALDTVIYLKKPKDYRPGEGARFEIHFEKSRNLTGAAVEPFEAHLTTTGDGHTIWVASSLEPLREQVLDLMKKGLSDTEIEKVIDKKRSRSTICKWRGEFKRKGLL